MPRVLHARDNAIKGSYLKSRLFPCQQGASLTQQPENEVQLVFHRRAWKQGPASSHLVEYTAHTPDRKTQTVMHKDPGIKALSQWMRPIIGNYETGLQLTSVFCLTAAQLIKLKINSREEIYAVQNGTGRAVDFAVFCNSWNNSWGEKPTHHMSICVEYSEEPSKTSGGRYHSVTTSLEYVLVGTDLALASPKEQK